MQPLRFKDKVVVVTGGASGIGKAIGMQFAANGARIALIDMDVEGLRVCEQEFAKKGWDVTGIACNVTHENECLAAMNNIKAHYGGIDVLVNNAGITVRDAFLHTEMVAYRQVMEVNFFGALYCTKAAMESLIASKGMLIVISSIAGVAPLPGRTGYCASKHALHGLFETLRIELKAHAVHVLIACPTFVKTNLQTRALGGDGKPAAHPQSTMGKVQSAEKTAKVIYAAAIKNKKRVILTPMGKAAFWLNRLMPELYARVIANRFKSELV